jgi:hypothetical protein
MVGAWSAVLARIGSVSGSGKISLLAFASTMPPVSGKNSNDGIQLPPNQPHYHRSEPLAQILGIIATGGSRTTFALVV